MKAAEAKLYLQLIDKFGFNSGKISLGNILEKGMKQMIRKNKERTDTVHTYGSRNIDDGCHTMYIHTFMIEETRPQSTAPVYLPYLAPVDFLISAMKDDRCLDQNFILIVVLGFACLSDDNDGSRSTRTQQKPWPK